jgi:hypothetical protein
VTYLPSVYRSGSRFSDMRERDTIDDELQLLATARRSIREQGSRASSRLVDELLDERNARTGIVKLFGNGCGAVDVSGLGGER